MKHYWWAEWKPEPPYKGKKITGSSSELQKIVDDITANLPDILSSDKKSVITSKLQECKNALVQLPIVDSEKKQVEKLLGVWETNKDEIIKLVTGTKAATEEKLTKETREEEKTKLKEGIAKLENLLNEISGLNLFKDQLKELIKDRIDSYGWGDDKAEAEINKKVGKDWETFIDEATDITSFETLKSNLLRILAEVIIDYWLITSKEEPKIRLGVIDNYLSEATEKETQDAIKATERAKGLTKLRDRCKDLKGTISLTMVGEMKITDEENADGNRMIAFSFEDLRTAFDDVSAIGKLPNINLTNEVNIYYNFTEEKDLQDRKFKELKNQLLGYKDRQLVFHFDKLEDKSHNLVRIEGTKIDLDYNSYTKIEVSGGTKIAKNWKDIHHDFDKNPLWKQNWEKGGYSWEQTKEWFNADKKLHPEDFMYVNWIKTTKKQDAEWYLNNSDDALTLRKEWLKSSITNRLNKYTTGGFKAEEEYNKWGKSEVHWGSDHRGKKWSEYLNKIDNLDIGDKSTEFSYLEVKDGLLVALAETLLPELITCNLAKDKNAKKADIINYLEINCSRAENNYYDREEGRIVKMKEKKWKNKSVREIVNSLN